MPAHRANELRKSNFTLLPYLWVHPHIFNELIDTTLWPNPSAPIRTVDAMTKTGVCSLSTPSPPIHDAVPESIIFFLYKEIVLPTPNRKKIIKPFFFIFVGVHYLLISLLLIR